MKLILLLLLQLLFNTNSFAVTKEFESFAFSNKGPHKTRSVVIIKNQKVVYQKSANNDSLNAPHRLWSISKSITSLLIGRAEQLGLLHRSDPVNKYLKDIQISPKIKISHLLEMSSGIDWAEIYETAPLKSDVVRMLYLDKKDDMGKFMAMKRSKFEPGTRFYYSSGETNLLMRVLKGSMPTERYESFPWKELFTKLDITTATWERDLSGTFVGSSYLFMSPLDLAKLGQFFLNNGKLNDEQVIPTDWIKYCSTLNAAHPQSKLEDDEELNEGYSAGWWLNTPITQNSGKRKYEVAPSDMVMALGHHGQFLSISPKNNLIIVRLAMDQDGKLDRDKFYSLLFKGLPGVKID